MSLRILLGHTIKDSLDERNSSRQDGGPISHKNDSLVCVNNYDTDD